MERTVDEVFWLKRRCLREPIPEIFHAAFLLDRAVGAHLANDHAAAAQLISAANMPAVRAWTESLWGQEDANPDQWQYLRVRKVEHAPPYLPKADRISVRMPTAEEQREIIRVYGRNCVFCGLPLIRKEVRVAMGRIYPEVLPWGGANSEQHAAFQCMWLQFDHLLPHSRGGGNSHDNTVVTCAPCNYGRSSLVLDEVGLLDPRKLPVHKTSWDGLERFFGRTSS